MNANDVVDLFPYSADVEGNGMRVVLLGRMGSRRTPGCPPRGPMRGSGITIEQLADYITGELEWPCEVSKLEPSREHPEMLGMLRDYRLLERRMRENSRGGYLEVRACDFMPAQRQAALLLGKPAVRDGVMIDRYFLLKASLPADIGLEAFAAGISMANDREPVRMVPYYRTETAEGTTVAVLGELSTRAYHNAPPHDVDSLRETLDVHLRCPYTITPLYPAMDNPDHLHLKHIYDSARGSRVPFRFAARLDVTADMFETLEDVERRARCEEMLAGKDGTLFVGELEFAPGADMMLVARANGILRQKSGLRVAPMGSSLRGDGTRVVKATGMKMGFFGPSPLNAANIVEMQRMLGCKATVRLIEAGMDSPDDLELYADANEALSDPNAATSMAAWMKPLDDGQDSLKAEASKLVGMETVLERIDEMVAYAANHRKVYGTLPQLHAVFSGNPGTGKTTVARILARKLGEAGALDRSDRFVETDRSGLVGLYVGHTAAKTHRCVDKAMGGVLFVDEAYSLNTGFERDYGHEAVNALVKRLEDDSEHFVCILAGYSKPMDEMLSMNPGLRSRMPFKVEFPDYTAEQLAEIFDRMLDTRFTIEDDARQLVAEFLNHAREVQSPDFANARTVRTVVQRIQMRQMMRRDDMHIDAEIVSSALADTDMAALVGPKKRPVGFVA